MGEGGDFEFNPIEPGAMLRRVMKVEFAQDGVRLGRFKGFLQAGRRAGIEIIRDEANPFRIGIECLNERPHTAREIGLGAVGCSLNMPPTSVGVNAHAPVTSSFPLIHIVIPTRVAWPDRQWQAGLAH